jgi:16S rRNA processing protein RimM
MTPADELPVGRITGAFGVRGELKCDPTFAGRTVFTPGVELRCERADGSLRIRIARVRPHKGRLLISLQGIATADAADAYRDAVLYAPRDAVALDEGEYLDADLVGCRVLGNDGTEYGTVERVEHYPGSDMLIVHGRMVPMVRAIVCEIDLEHRRIRIDPPSGLLD